MTNSAANENVKVTYKKGEDRCHCCGRYIRNIVEIDGVPYGTKCADGFLPRGQRVGKDFDSKFKAQEFVAWQAVQKANATWIHETFGRMPGQAETKRELAHNPAWFAEGSDWQRVLEYHRDFNRGFKW